MQVSAYASKHYPAGLGVPDYNISTAVVSLSGPDAVRQRLAYLVGDVEIPLAWATVVVHYDQFVERFKHLSPRHSDQFTAAKEFLIYCITSGNHDAGRWTLHSVACGVLGLAFAAAPC